MAEPDEVTGSATALQRTTHRGTLSVTAPGDWFAKESLTLLAPDGQANVIASTEPLDSSIDVQQYTQVQGDLLRTEFPGYRELAFSEIGIDGLPGPVYFREFEWTPPDGVTVAQMQIYAVHDSRGITATGTTPAEGFAAYRDRLGDIILSLVLAPAPAHVAGGSDPLDHH